MGNEVEFKGYGKTQRFSNLEVTITEKLDGTNACVIIKDGKLVGTQSRNRMITPENDNMGFSRWAYSVQEELTKLGDGYHYGEWAGPAIQKNPHNFEEKGFYLFNTHRPQESLPDCVKMVPVLYQGPFDGQSMLDNIMEELLLKGKEEGYTPEGIIIYWHGFRTCQKYTFHANLPKWQLK